MMDAMPRQPVGPQQVERVLPELGVEWRDGKDVDRDARLEQRAHVALEERRHLGRIAAGEDGQPHDSASLGGAVAPVAAAIENVSHRIFDAIHVPLMQPTNVTTNSASGRAPQEPRRARHALPTQSAHPMRNGIVPRMPVDDIRSSTMLWASRLSFFSSPMRAPISNWFSIGPQPRIGFSLIMLSVAG